MSKRKRIIVGRIRHEVWFSEESLRSAPEFQFIEKLHTPDGANEALDGLVELGFLKERYRAGQREFMLDKELVARRIAELPPEKRKSPRELKIFEWAGTLCDYDNDATTLLSFIAEQTDKTSPGYPVTPWIEKTREELEIETIGMIQDLDEAFKKLVDRTFILLVKDDADHFRYLFNIPAVQAAINRMGVQG